VLRFDGGWFGGRGLAVVSWLGEQSQKTGVRGLVDEGMKADLQVPYFVSGASDEGFSSSVALIHQ
jgi:hypothetical protein